MNLNAAQREAIAYLDGPLLVLAGAGSGKTRVITEKIAYLILECGLSPANIAAITFTNKAAAEMKERVAKLLRGNDEGLTVSTFHALGVRILREEARHLGLKNQFSILDAQDTFKIVADLSGSTDKGTIYRLQSSISSWKNALLTTAQIHTSVNNNSTEIEKLAAPLYANYIATLKAYQAVDFDDLIGFPVALFSKNAEVLSKWQNRLRYLLVDEYQDTNACQYKLLQQLAGVRASFTAVGDDDQAIYGWRGADVKNLRQLPEDYPNLKVIKLEQNYRSTGNILRAANKVISHNEKLFDKKLWSEFGAGEDIRVSSYKDNEKEAEALVMKLQAHKSQSRDAFSDYAILYRGNFQARVLEEHLRNQRIPYQISGGQSFFDRAEIRDITAYLRLIANADDDPAFIRAITTPRRGAGNTTLEALGTYAGMRQISLFRAATEQGFAIKVQARQLAPLVDFCRFIESLADRAPKEPAQNLIESLLSSIGYEAWLFADNEKLTAQTKLENVRELQSWLGRRAEEEGKNLLELTQMIALINQLNKSDKNEEDQVRLSTLHAAKGLEFKHVFLVGIEEDVLPHRESQSLDKIEEERRLMYVGITRAKRSLFISYAEKKRQGRDFYPVKPSRFIAEMGKEGVLHATENTQVLSKAESLAKIAALRSRFSENKPT